LLLEDSKHTDNLVPQNIGFRCQVSAQLLAKKTADLIEKETLKNRMTNDE